MKTGSSILIKATVLRVEGNRLDAQTANGQLIQTDISNVMNSEEKPTATAKPEKPKTAERKSVPPSENKAILNAPENKSNHRGR